MLWLEIDGERHAVPEKLKIGEMVVIQDITGKTSAEAFQSLGRGDMKSLAAWMLVIKSRDDPTVTLDDIYDVHVGDFDVIEEADQVEEDEPLPPAEPDDVDDPNPSGDEVSG